MAQDFEYDGTPLKEFGFNVRITGAPFAMPGRRGENIIIPGRDGRMYVEKPLEERQETLTMYVRDETSASSGHSEDNLLYNLDLLRRLFGQGGQHVLAYTVASERRVALAEVVDKFEFVPHKASAASLYEFVVTFRMADPIWYADAVSTVGPTAIDGTSVDIALDNPGTYEAQKAQIVLTGPLTDPVLTIGTNWLKYTGTIDTEFLTIDCGTFVALMGGADVSDAITHEGALCWLPIPAGVSTLNVASSGYGGGSGVTVSWTAGYL